MLLYLKLCGWVCMSPTQEPAISPQYFIPSIAWPEKKGKFGFDQIEQMNNQN